MTQSEVLHFKMQLTCRPLAEALQRHWQREDAAEAFVAFLILFHQIIRASVPLMVAARDEARSRSDPLCADLATYLDGHIAEEQDHDDWLLNDLNAAGAERETVLARTPLPRVASMVGAQYYWIHHHHPVAVLGYIAVLESNPPSVAHIDRIKRQSGLPDAAFDSYRMHGEADHDHMASFNSALDQLPLTPALAGLIGMSMANTAQLLAECIDGLTPP